MVGGSEDPAVTPTLTRAFFDPIGPARVYLLIPGAHHSELIENAGAPAAFLTPTTAISVAFLDAHLGGNGGALDEVIASLREQGTPSSSTSDRGRLPGRATSLTAGKMKGRQLTAAGRAPTRNA